MENLTFHFLLWLITLVFLMRVLAQIFVGIYSPSYLPKMEMWYSGLLPYPILLTYQMFMYTCMVIFNFCFYMGKGPLFYFLNPSTQRYFVYFGLIYFVLMVIRFIVHKVKDPETRWPRGTIPIFFHFFLSTYIILMGSYPFFNLKINFN